MGIKGSLSDVYALLDSYAVEIWRGGLLYSSTPLYYFQMGILELDDLSRFNPTPVIDEALNVRLCRYKPSVGDRTPPLHARWPFFVEQPLEIVLSLASPHGVQWWLYKFSVGRQYEEREVVLTCRL